MSTTQRLKDLLGRATPGPWECAWGASRQPIARAYSTKADTDGKAFGLYGATMVPIRVDEDMELCAESRNALPALLAVVEAAADVCEEWPSPHVVKTPLDRRMAELIAALAALNTEQKTNG